MNDKTPKQGAKKVSEGLLEITETTQKWFSEPTGWVLSGIVLIIISSGSLAYTTDNMAFELGQNTGSTLRYLFNLLGIIMVTVGLLVVSTKWVENQKTLQFLFISFLLMAVGSITKSHFYKTPNYPLDYVTYDYQNKKMFVEMRLHFQD